jgi:hypothetical protein
MRKTTTTSAITMRITICFFVWLSAFVPVKAQQNNLESKQLKVWGEMMHENNVYVSVYAGYGSYSMYGMRRLQNELIALSGLNATPNSDFPPFWLYGITVSQKYDYSRFGFELESMSTGARSSIADYSGQFISDFRCSGLKLGVFIEKDLSFKVKKLNELSFGYRFEAGGLSSSVLQQSQITINNLDEGTATGTIKLVSIAPFFEPSIFAKWNIEKKTFIQFSAGYMLDIPTSLQFSYSMSEYRIGWAGYRLKLGLIRQL